MVIPDRVVFLEGVFPDSFYLVKLIWPVRFPWHVLCSTLRNTCFLLHALYWVYILNKVYLSIYMRLEHQYGNITVMSITAKRHRCFFCFQLSYSIKLFKLQDHLIVAILHHKYDLCGNACLWGGGMNDANLTHFLGVENDVNSTRFAGLLDFGLGYQKFSVRGPAGYWTFSVNFKHWSWGIVAYVKLVHAGHFLCHVRHHVRTMSETSAVMSNCPT